MNKLGTAAILAAIAASSAACAGGLGASVKSDLERQLATTHAPIAACYQSALEKDPKLAGKVWVKFKVHESSRTPTQVAVESSEVKDEELTKCIVLETQDVRLSEPPGVPIAVTYPLDLALASSRP